MARIYARRIKGGLMSLDDVPARWRAEVEELLGAEADAVE